MIYSVRFLFVLFSSVNAWTGTTVCVKTSTCSCRKGNGDTIDLSALSKHDGTPWFQNVTDTQNMDNYSLSMCDYFSQGSCYSVAICQIRPSFPYDLYFDVGYLRTAEFMENEIGQITINYTAGNRRALVSLTCSHIIEAQLIALGEQPPQSSIYHFELISKYACPMTSPDSSSSNNFSTYAGAGGGGFGFFVLVVAAIFRKRLLSKLGINCDLCS